MICEVQSPSNVSELILSIKSEVNDIIKEEMKRLGLRDIKLTDKPAPRQPSDRMPHSRLKVTAPKPRPHRAKDIAIASDGVQARPDMSFEVPASENISDDDLVGMTMGAIEANFKRQWSKLSDAQRRDRIRKFAENWTRINSLSTEIISDLAETLRFKIIVDKSIKLSEFQYDPDSGNIIDVPSLNWDDQDKKFSFNTERNTQKRCLPAKKQRVSDITSLTRPTVDEADHPTNDDEIRHKIAKNKVTKHPKLIKTLTKLKRPTT